MPKYDVNIEMSGWLYYSVKADSEEEALDLAKALHENRANDDGLELTTQDYQVELEQWGEDK